MSNKEKPKMSFTDKIIDSITPDIPDEAIEKLWHDFTEEVMQDDDAVYRLQCALLVDCIHLQDHIDDRQRKNLEKWLKKWANDDCRTYIEMIENKEIPPIEIRMNSKPRDYEQCYENGKKSYRKKDKRTFLERLFI